MSVKRRHGLAFLNSLRYTKLLFLYGNCAQSLAMAWAIRNVSAGSGALRMKRSINTARQMKVMR